MKYIRYDIKSAILHTLYATAYPIGIFLLLSGCNTNYYLKRAEINTRKAIERGAKVKVDTIYQEHTVFVPQVRVDSIFTSKVGDTVRIYKDRLKLKYVRIPGDSVFIEGKCEADTVKISVPYTVTEKVKSGIGVINVVQWALLALIVGAILSRILWK